MTTDTSERGLERLICTVLTGSPCDPGAGPTDMVHDRPAIYGAGWIGGDPNDYDREYCVDLVQLSAFDDGRAQGRYGTLQAVHGQRVISALANGHRVQADL